MTTICRFCLVVSMSMRKLLFALICLFNVQPAKAQEIREFMDLQTHTAIHIPYGFFSDGLTYFPKNAPPRLRFKHMFTNVNYANFLENNPGARIIINGAINKEWVQSREKARRVILEQIEYVNAFIQTHADKFALATTPQEVRDLVFNTNKTIVIHSIEGGRRIIDSQEDADFWASKGVAFVTLVHLLDDENGASAITPGFFTSLMNLKGVFRKEKNRGLTEHGKNAIRYLANAGIMTDLTHMSAQTRRDALDFMYEQQIPPILTHDGFRSVHNSPRGISEADIISIYQHNGFVSLPLSGAPLVPRKSSPVYQQLQDSLNRANCYCAGSVDNYKFSYLALKQFVEGNAAVISKDSAVVFSKLTDAQKVKYAIGFESDFNGWLSHERPRYGKKGCYPMVKTSAYAEFEQKGLAHPGLIKGHWDALSREGVDLQPIKRASEKFLQLWEYFLVHRKEKH